jgi:hypothetical protein
MPAHRAYQAILTWLETNYRQSPEVYLAHNSSELAILCERAVGHPISEADLVSVAYFHHFLPTAVFDHFTAKRGRESVFFSMKPK